MDMNVVQTLKLLFKTLAPGLTVEKDIEVDGMRGFEK